MSNSKPANIESLRERLNRVRETVAPTVSSFEEYHYRSDNSLNKETTVHVAYSLLKYRGSGYNIYAIKSPNATPPDVGFNDGLLPPVPILSAILYKNISNPVTLPHLAGKWTHRSTDQARAVVKTAYDGASLVYGGNQTFAYPGEPDDEKHVAVTTFTSGRLNY
ncbi:hypothetical protein BJ875DRAFT_485958 [Amylocarpus encephaloides]|uniref:Uncharacterized protein n=1 Tax=Amylocarpus encephaloides TaxID=45428 RepID=A0A9P7YG17_9HELO|nr:hypothetical protein BJ875DRAFT_485958 [Amylocarpus encephaloides]